MIMLPSESGEAVPGKLLIFCLITISYPFISLLFHNRHVSCRVNVAKSLNLVVCGHNTLLVLSLNSMFLGALLS